MSKIICYCSNVSEQTIKAVIAKGARSLKAIQQQTGACIGDRCKELNPSGECCSKEIQKMLPNQDDKCCCCK